MTVCDLVCKNSFFCDREFAFTCTLVLLYNGNRRRSRGYFGVPSVLLSNKTVDITVKMADNIVTPVEMNAAFPTRF